jgi:hypothetical protein
MKSRTSATTGTTELPPPPAPTSRDANPWPISTVPKGVPAERPERAAPHPRRPRRDARGPAEPRGERDRWLPATIMFFVAGAGLKLAIEALESGDLESAVGAFVFVAMAAFFLWRRMKRKA